MKKSLAAFFLVLASVIPAFAQGPAFGYHNMGGIYYAPIYNTWRATIVSGNTGTGSGTSIVVSAPTSLIDGYAVNPASVFNTNVPILVNDNNSETVTPTSVSIGSCGAFGNAPSGTCATVTGTFNNTHGAGSALIVQSGDNGIEEALTDAGNFGGGLVFWQVDTGNVTLSTSGATTTTTTKIPTQYINFGASAIVETTIATATNWAIGVASHTSAFCSANSTLTAGTTCIANQVAPTVTGTTTALTALLITTTGSQTTAGVVKTRVWGYTPVQAAN
jgi:hypothetical protein